MNLPTIYFLVGPPNSGKTTVAQKYIQQGAIHLSTDKFIEKFAKQNDLTYSESFEQYYRQADMELRRELGEAIRNNKDIVYDQTNLTKKSRAHKLGMIPKNYYKVCIVVETKSDTIFARNINRIKDGRSIPVNVINNMLTQFEIPDISEGYNEVFNVFGE